MKTSYSSSDNFKQEPLLSKYKIMVSYLNFLYLETPQLELEVILILFNGDESVYQLFMTNKLAIEQASHRSHQLFLFLKNRGYPCSVVEYQKKASTA